MTSSADSATLAAIFKLSPEEAISYLKRKGFSITWSWREISADAHARAFTVAKAMQMDILTDIRSEVERASSEGTTFQEFKKQLKPRLQARGWWGAVLDELGNQIQLGSVRRLETIYRTNLQSAYMAGRYRDFMENTQARPWFQYVAVMDQRTRPTHAALNGKVFRFDDPFWNDFMPPNGYACRCRIRALSDANVRSRNLTTENSIGYLHSVDQGGERRAIYQSPDMGYPISPDQGFTGNQALSAWKPNLAKYDPDLVHRYQADMRSK